ncbi:MAG TPA: gas vesicle protein K [Candidatus Binataceae bacterium]|nr:gas vesicle protein K [Candidatus Binataceae bacterium]
MASQLRIVPRPPASDRIGRDDRGLRIHGAPPRRIDPAAERDRRIDINSEDLKNGLAQLVLTLVKLLHELLEKQAIRRIESGRLSEADCERVGLTLMKQSEQIEKLRLAFGLAEEDLNLDLGPLGKLL